MTISISTDYEKKDIPQWEEIFIGPHIKDLTPDTIKGSGTDGDILVIEKLKSQIVKNSPNVEYLKFDPLIYIESDLFGNFSLKKNINLFTWFNSDDLRSQREVDLMKFLFEELFFHIKNFKGNLENDIIELVISFLAIEGKIEELNEIYSLYNQNGIVLGKLEAFLFLVGTNDLVNFENFQTEKILFLLCKHKKMKLTDTEIDELYDTLISGRRKELLGLVYFYFCGKLEGLRNAYPLFQIMIKKFDQFSLDEKDKFVKDFIRTNQYFKSYLLMKNIYSKAEIQSWLNDALVINGKIINPILKDLENDKSLSKKYEFLKERNLVYLLSPFEILILLNSPLGENLRSEILSAKKIFFSSYIVLRSLAVLHFFDEDYLSFFNYMNHTGRLKFGAECLYLRAIALKEIGESEEGNNLIYALENKFPNSYLLKSVKENHRI